MGILTVVRREFLFKDYRDWFLNNSDKDFAKGKYIGRFILYHIGEEPKNSRELGFNEVNVFNLHKNMNLIYFEFHRKITETTDFLIDIYDEENNIHHRKVLIYSKNKDVNIEGIFVPVMFLMNSTGSISMGTNVFLKWKKYMEDVNALKNKSS